MARRFSPTLLRQRRLAAGLRQERVALHIERSTSLVLKYELGDARPSVEALGRLADALNCSTDDFFEKEAAA